MSRPPRRGRHRGRHAPSAVRAPSVASQVDPAAGVRALVEEGIVAAAALQARNDLDLAAESTQRLGTLTSGMWRALSRELATAAERLDRSTAERMDDIHRRAAILQIDADDVFRAGEAAAHLAEHSATLETLLAADDDGRRLLGPELLFGFSLDVEDEDEDEDDDDDDSESAPHPVRVSLFLWPAPLEPAIVTVVPSLPGVAVEEAEDVALELSLAATPLLLEALSTACELSPDQLSQALTQLGVACFTAHHLDELPPDESEGEDLDDDVAQDDGSVGDDGI